MAKENMPDPIMDLAVNEICEMLWSILQRQHYKNQYPIAANMINILMKKDLQPAVREMMIKYKLRHQDQVANSRKKHIGFINIYNDRLPGASGVLYIYPTREEAEKGKAGGSNGKTMKFYLEP